MSSYRNNWNNDLSNEDLDEDYLRHKYNEGKWYGKTIDEVCALQREIDFLKIRRSLGKKTNTRLNFLEARLGYLRNACFHNYEIVTLLVTVRKMCSKCKLEDLSYFHSEEMSKKDQEF